MVTEEALVQKETDTSSRGKVLCALHTASCPSRFQGIEVAQAFQKGTLGHRQAYQVSKRRAVVQERQ